MLLRKYYRHVYLFYWLGLSCQLCATLAKSDEDYSIEADSSDEGSTESPLKSEEENISEELKKEQCFVNAADDLPSKNEPLLLSQDATDGVGFIFPEVENSTGFVILDLDQEILVACPGDKNYLELTKQQVTKVTCRSGNELHINGTVVNAEELKCHSKPLAATIVTWRACAGSRGATVELGFEVPEWVKLMESCHNFALSSTYYTIHSINGSRLGGKTSKRLGKIKYPLSNESLFFSNVNPDLAYSQKNQRAVFSGLLGETWTSEMLDRKSGKYLVRGHLAPVGDFLLSPHQILSHSFINVAPQWQSINTGNWLKLEELVRKLASELGTDFEIATGTFGSLRLPGEKGLRKIYLQRWKIPVPEFFWKAVRNIEDDSCIVFLVSNNPFLSDRPRRLCSDICAENGWPRLQTDLSKGYMVCCDYHRIRKIFSEIPFLQCSQTLRNIDG